MQTIAYFTYHDSGFKFCYGKIFTAVKIRTVNKKSCLMNGLQAEKNTVSNEHWLAKAKFGINGTDIKLTEYSI